MLAEAKKAIDHWAYVSPLLVKPESEIGSQGVVSEILNGKRELNLQQIRKLAEKFGLPEQVFI